MISRCHVVWEIVFNREVYSSNRLKYWRSEHLDPPPSDASVKGTFRKDIICPYTEFTQKFTDERSIFSINLYI